MIGHLDKQYNLTKIPWDEIREDPQSFYSQQQFDLPFPLVDPQTISGGKIVSLAEYFQEQGSAFRFHKCDQRIQPPQESVSRGVRAVTPLAPTPGVSTTPPPTSESRSSSTPGPSTAPPPPTPGPSTAPPPPPPTSGPSTVPPPPPTTDPSTAPPPPTPGPLTAPPLPHTPDPLTGAPSAHMALSLGGEPSTHPVISLPSAQAVGGEAAPPAPTPISSTSGGEQVDIPAPSTTPIPSALTASCEAVVPAPTLPLALISETEEQGTSSTNAIASEPVGGKHGAGAGRLRRDNRGGRTVEDTAGSSNEAGPSRTRGAVAGKKQSKYWTYILEPATGPAETTTNDGTSVTPPRKRRRPVKAVVDAGGSTDASVKEPRKKKQKRI